MNSYWAGLLGAPAGGLDGGGVSSWHLLSQVPKEPADQEATGDQVLWFPVSPLGQLLDVNCGYCSPRPGGAVSLAGNLERGGFLVPASWAAALSLTMRSTG